ncbi:MAG: hypothetical protein ACPGC9_02130 [Cytophagales bacterium]
MFNIIRKQSFKRTLALLMALFCFSMPAVKCSEPTFAKECQFGVTSCVIGAAIGWTAYKVFMVFYSEDYANTRFLDCFSREDLKSFGRWMSYGLLAGILGGCVGKAIFHLNSGYTNWKRFYAKAYKPSVTKGVSYALVGTVLVRSLIFAYFKLLRNDFNSSLFDDVFMPALAFAIQGSLGGGICTFFNCFAYA